jgi:4-deoxy-L-threo-5-hexosulose-uronate ketol-isomerase
MQFEIRHGLHPEHGKKLDTEGLRKNLLLADLFLPGKIKAVYSYIDRIIVGGVCPVREPVALEAGKEMGVEYFLERRELGIVNLGPTGRVNLDGQDYELAREDVLYVGKGVRRVAFASLDPAAPARFYLNSAPAHCAYPSRRITREAAKKVPLGSSEEANRRVIHQYIHPDVLETCQLVLGITHLEPGSVWNTMPCHTHDRRMEVYFYFNLPSEALVVHLVGAPTETRHLILRNEEAVIMPSWSIHAGVGTRNYSFVWGMVGENQTFNDMDHVPMTGLR